MVMIQLVFGEIVDVVDVGAGFDPPVQRELGSFSRYRVVHSLAAFYPSSLINVIMYCPKSFYAFKMSFVRTTLTVRAPFQTEVLKACHRPLSISAQFIASVAAVNPIIG